jgi:LPS-assembly lipoprotein
MRAVLASLTLLLAACGFSPMYGSSSAGSAHAIGPVAINEIDGKAGHVLRTELMRILDVENDGSPPSDLHITLSEQVAPLGLRRDESATRAELRLIANYVLTPPNGRVMRGSVVTVVDYDVPTAAFGEISAQDDARERAGETMAERFRAELALRMAQARSESAQR